MNWKKLTAVWAVLFAAVVVASITHSITPEEYFALQVRKALVTENLHAYNLVRYEGKWLVNVFNTTGMWTMAIEDGPWPKKGKAFFAKVTPMGEEFATQNAFMGPLYWRSEWKVPRYMAAKRVSGAQDFLNEILSGNPHNKLAKLGVDYGTIEGDVYDLWAHIRTYIDHEEYNRDCRPSISI